MRSMGNVERGILFRDGAIQSNIEDLKISYKPKLVLVQNSDSIGIKTQEYGSVLEQSKPKSPPGKVVDNDAGVS